MAKGKILAVEERDGRTYYRVETPDGVREIETTQARKAESAAASKTKDDAKTTEAPLLYQYDLDASLMTVAEYRERKGLPPDARFGNLTIAEYVAANREVFALAAAARLGKVSVEGSPEPESGGATDGIAERLDEILELLRRRPASDGEHAAKRVQIEVME